jgi:vitamin B12 transporter
MSRLLITASFAALALASPTFAQETEGSIVVTATRQESEQQALPADVIVVDAERAIERGAQILDEALADVPGLAIVRSGPFGQQSSIFAGGANSNHTLVLYDGIRINDPSTPGAGFDAGQDLLGGLDRIEIVEGPMSALYGSDAVGGVINLIPRRGGEGVLNARMDMAGGSFGTLLGAAGIDGTVGSLRYAVSAEGFASDGYDIVPERMSTHTGDADGAEMAALTGAFDLELSEAFSLDLLLRRREARADFDAFIFDSTVFNERRVDDPDLEISRNDLSLARVGATWAIVDSLSLRASGGVVATDRAQADGGLETDRFEGERRFGDATLGWESQTLRLLGGVSAETEEIDALQFGSPIIAEQDHWSGFVTAQASVGRFDFTGALRADDFEGFGTATTWRAGASFRILDHARLYAAYGTSFRAPTLYERFVFFGNPDLEPEEGESWEIGADAQFAAFGQEDGLELGALYRRTDLQAMIDFGPAFTFVNIDEAEIESAEARIALRPLEWLTARASYIYTDARDAATGDLLLRRPEHAFSASLAIEQGGLSGEIAWRGVGERADILYDDDGFFLGAGVADSYELLRVSGAYEIHDGVRIFAVIDNALDETYEPANAFAGARRSLLVGLRLAP